MKIVFLVLGIILSVLSKFLQFRYGSKWGDLLILPAAVFFTLTILLVIPRYVQWLHDPAKAKAAIALAIFACGAVLFFQLFTMFTFGRGHIWGTIFLIPCILLIILSLIMTRKLL